MIDFLHSLSLKFGKSTKEGIKITRAETNIRNVTNETSSKRMNIRIFVRFDE